MCLQERAAARRIAGRAGDVCDNRAAVQCCPSVEVRCVTLCSSSSRGSVMHRDVDGNGSGGPKRGRCGLSSCAVRGNRPRAALRCVRTRGRAATVALSVLHAPRWHPGSLVARIHDARMVTVAISEMNSGAPWPALQTAAAYTRDRSSFGVGDPPMYNEQEVTKKHARNRAGRGTRIHVSRLILFSVFARFLFF